MACNLPRVLQVWQRSSMSAVNPVCLGSKVQYAAYVNGRRIRWCICKKHLETAVCLCLPLLFKHEKKMFSQTFLRRSITLCLFYATLHTSEIGVSWKRSSDHRLSNIPEAYVHDVQGINVAFGEYESNLKSVTCGYAGASVDEYVVRKAGLHKRGMSNFT